MAITPDGPDEKGPIERFLGMAERGELRRRCITVSPSNPEERVVHGRIKDATVDGGSVIFGLGLTWDAQDGSLCRLDVGVMVDNEKPPRFMDDGSIVIDCDPAPVCVWPMPFMDDHESQRIKARIQQKPTVLESVAANYRGIDGHLSVTEVKSNLTEFTLELAWFETVSGRRDKKRLPIVVDRTRLGVGLSGVDQLLVMPDSDSVIIVTSDDLSDCLLFDIDE